LCVEVHRLLSLHIVFLHLYFIILLYILHFVFMHVCLCMCLCTLCLCILCLCTLSLCVYLCVIHFKSMHCLFVHYKYVHYVSIHVIWLCALYLFMHCVCLCSQFMHFVFIYALWVCAGGCVSIHFTLHSMFCALSFARYLCVEVHHWRFEILLTFCSHKRVLHLLFALHPLIPLRSCTCGKKCQVNIKLQLFSSIFNLLNLNLCHYLLPILLKVGGDGLFFNSKFLSFSINNILLACVGYDNCW